MTKIKSVQITVTGRVQNVGFRYATNEKAQELGIKGFVKNQLDGTVYIEAEADESTLDQFVLWCHNGPNWTKVYDVKVIIKPLVNFTKFEIRR